jgi:excisionase family DNA binding protein
MAPMKRPAGQDADVASSLSLQQVARRWSVPRRVVRRLLQQGELPFEQVRGQLRVTLRDVRHYERTKARGIGSPGRTELGQSAD